MNSEHRTFGDRVRAVFSRLSRAIGFGSDDRADGSDPDHPVVAGDGGVRTGTDDRVPTAGPGSDGTLTRTELAAKTGLRPECYVRQLLEAHGGRLRQREVAELARLSESTTSRLLSQMEAEQQVRRMTIGREKVVCLPAAAPEAVEEAV